jgi:hypothetical protein
MANIIFPTSATEQGHAFEDLILSYYQKSGLYNVCEWSGYFHGMSGKWWQCDGIVENSEGRYLIEAKFFRDRPATVRDIKPERREAAAQDMDCTGLLYISLNGFVPSMLNWSHDPTLDVHFFTWPDLRADLLSGLTAYSSVLLDQFELRPTQAISIQGAASFYYDTLNPTPLSPRFPEFVTVPDKLELWLRRMPNLPLQLAQNSAGKFYYSEATEQVALIPDRATDLSLQEAWAIQDAISGYASRTYNAVRATAEALSKMSDGLITDIQNELHKMGWNTGVSGVRSSLDFLVLLRLARKWTDRRRTRYTLTPLGRAFTLGGKADDAFFETVLRKWLPYQAMGQAIIEHDVPATADDILTYFKAQYAPYEPYARSLFNPNKADGLIRLYKQFGS